MLVSVLGMSGADVIAAPTAAEGLAALESAHPDVLLSDIEMPGEDGWAFIAKVRALPKEKGGTVPAGALTAYASREHRDRALAAGFDSHVPKPVEPAELVRAGAGPAGP